MPIDGRRGRPPAGLNGEKTSAYPQISIRLPPETFQKIHALRTVLEVPMWRVVADAVSAYDARRQTKRG